MDLVLGYCFLSLLNRKVGVYVFRLNRRFGRLKGESDILYVGHTENLEHRFIDNYYR